MLLGELWWAQSAGAIPGNPLRAFVSVAVAMFLDASGFHAGSFAPALSSRKVHPVYRLRLFIGHPQAGWRSAVIYSLLLSCRRRGINPQSYLSDALSRLPSTKITEIHQLLPGHWKPSPPNTS